MEIDLLIKLNQMRNESSLSLLLLTLEKNADVVTNIAFRFAFAYFFVLSALSVNEA